MIDKGEIMYRINTVLCLIKVNRNPIELTVYTSFNFFLDILCVTSVEHLNSE